MHRQKHKFLFAVNLCAVFVMCICVFVCLCVCGVVYVWSVLVEVRVYVCEIL